MANIINALVPFGIAGFAIAAIVWVLRNPKSTPSWLVLSGILLIAAVFAFDRYLQSARQIQPTSPSDTPPLPKPVQASASEFYWFETGTQADWGGADLAHTHGIFPKYKSKLGRDLCDATRVGNLAVCWDNRSGGKNPGVADTDATDSEKEWCTYKDMTVRISGRPTGLAQPGRIFMCARYVPR